MKIALVHDWILKVGGAEKVLAALHKMWPSAPIYTLLHDLAFTKTFLPKAKIHSTFLQKIYKYTGSLRLLAPLMPTAIESIDLRDYDVVISTGPIYAKGVVVRPTTRHISYCYSPSRQLWD